MSNVRNQNKAVDYGSFIVQKNPPRNMKKVNNIILNKKQHVSNSDVNSYHINKMTQYKKQLQQNKKIIIGRWFKILSKINEIVQI